jgi:hypothetical protein
MTGRPPHEGSNIMEVLTRKATQAPTPLQAIRPDAPPELSSLVMRMLAQKREDRPASMDVLAGDLGALIGLVTPGPTDRVAPVETLPSSTERVPRKRSAWIFGGVLAAGGVMIVTALLVSQMGKQGPSGAPVSVVSANPPPPSEPAPAPVPPPDPAPAPAPVATRPAPPTPKKIVVESPVTVRRPVERAVPPPAAAVSDREKRAEAARLLKDARRALVAGSLAQAESLYQKVEDTGFEKPAALTGLGECAFQAGNYADAVRRARRAVESGGGVAARMVLGNAYFKLQQYDNAIGAYKEVLKLDGRHEEAQQNLAAAERKRGG